MMSYHHDCQLPGEPYHTELTAHQTFACCSLLIYFRVSQTHNCQPASFRASQHRADNTPQIKMTFAYFFSYLFYGGPACQLPVRASQHRADSTPQIMMTLACSYSFYLFCGGPACQLPVKASQHRADSTPQIMMTFTFCSSFYLFYDGPPP